MKSAQASADLTHPKVDTKLVHRFDVPALGVLLHQLLVRDSLGR
jgi:hypothetical protein